MSAATDPASAPSLPLSHDSRPGAAASLRGNRLALGGALLYLLEWVAIIGAGVGVPLVPGSSGIASQYAGHAGALGFAAGWFALVLVGRVLFASGVAAALRGARASRPLAAVGVVVMGASVALEVTTYAVTAAAAQTASTAVVVGLNDVAWVLDQMVMPLLGISILCLVAAGWTSGVLGRWVHLPGLVGGLLMTGSALLVSPQTADAYTAVANLGVPFFWVWMIWVSVLCWRGRHAREA